jgi:hypothetical protein
MLLLFLNFDGYKLQCKDVQISDFLDIDNIIYVLDSQSKKSDGFMGFFDWLRADESTIIGIRMCLFPHQAYIDLFSQLPYLKVTIDARCLEIKFADIEYNETLSGDQDFSKNFIYKADLGYLVTFNLDHLSSTEIESLRPYLESDSTT